MTVPGSEWRFPNRATPPGSSAYYSVRFAPPALRDTLAALFGWRHEVRAVLDDVSDPGVARLKLDWWRDELARTAEGVPRHPLSRLLRPAVDTYRLPTAPFLDIAARAEGELRGHHSEDDAAQREAAERDRGSLLELAVRCHDLTDTSKLAEARRIGGWCQRVRLLRDSGLLLRRNREVLPGERLAAAGLNHEALASREQRHRLPALLEPLAEALVDERPSRQQLAPLPAAVRIQARIHAALLDEIGRSGYAVTDQRIGLTPLRKLWIAWRAS